MPILEPDLIFAHADSPKFHATTKAHGLYNTFEFVLRLSPRVHSAIAGLTPGITTGVSFEQLQAMSTYLHETVHWWQHIGSTYGFILGLNYPVQTHCVVGNLKKLADKAGFKKSVLQHSALLNALGPKGVDTPAGISNIIVNNHFDLEVFRAYTLGARWMEPLVKQPLFEAVGHALNMTYGQTLYVLGTTADPTFSAVPNPDQWQESFRQLRADKVPGYHYGQSVELWEIGAEEIFEGQARFIQIQYLFQASGKAAQWKDFADLGMLDGVYVRAFQSFLNGTESEWPDRIDDPLVGLFLLICDMAINPGSGFPFPVQPFFKTFITDVNPGSRFMMLCRLVSLKHPNLKMVYRGGCGAIGDRELQPLHVRCWRGRAWPRHRGKENAMTYFVGLDVSVLETAVCVVDEAGKVICEQKVPSEPDDIVTLLTSIGEDYGRVGIEAGPLSQWLVNGMAEAGLPVICVETRHMKSLLKAQQINKSDRHDACGIAQMMRVGLFRPVHVKTLASQEKRMLLTARKLVQRKMLDVDADLRGTLRNFGLKVGAVGQAGFETRIRELVEGLPTLAAIVEPMLTIRRVMRQEFSRLHKMLLNVVRHDPVCQRLMTAPGVGAVVALTYRATVDQPQRFVHSRAVGAHIGLTPRRHQSGEIDYDGGISKSGDTMLRTMLYEAAQILLTQRGK